MTYLEKLEITRRALGARKSRRRAPLLEHSRKKLIANIEEQIQLARLKIAGRPLELRRRRGRRIATVRPKLWWEIGPDGKVGTYIVFRKTAMNLGGLGPTIEVPSLKQLPKVYETVIRAVHAGELDVELEKVAKGMRKPNM